MCLRQMILLCGAGLGVLWGPVGHESRAECGCGRRAAARTIFCWNACCPPSQPDESLATDRPDFTESVATVGRGRRQLEIGYTFIEDEETGQSLRTHAYPQALLRVGLWQEWLELRLFWTVVDETLVTATGRGTSVGSGDLGLGVKLGLTEQCGWLPAMALLPQMTVPSGSGQFGADEVLPGLNWIYGWDLSDVWSFAGSTQLNRDLDENDHGYTLWAQSLVTGLSLTDQLGAFVEWFAFFPHSASEPSIESEHYLDGGFTFLLNENLQYDVSAGVGLNEAAEDYFLGTGLSIRF